MNAARTKQSPSPLILRVNPSPRPRQHAHNGFVFCLLAKQDASLQSWLLQAPEFLARSPSSIKKDPFVCSVLGEGVAAYANCAVDSPGHRALVKCALSGVNLPKKRERERERTPPPNTFTPLW